MMQFAGVFGLVACSDHFLTASTDKADVTDSASVFLVDTGVEDVPLDASGDSALPELSDSGDVDSGIPDTGDSEPPVDCREFTFAWSPGMYGDIVLSGELQNPDGTVFMGWRDWESVTDQYVEHTWTGLCGSFAFRGSGAIDVDNDGKWDSFTCFNQADHSDLLIGVSEAYLDDEALVVESIPSREGDDGCGVFVEATW